MNLIDQYLRRSQEIIGDRTESEEQYDNEVVKWLKEGLTIRKAIDKANERYPGEALQLDETSVADVCFCQPKTGPLDNRKQAHLAHFV